MSPLTSSEISAQAVNVFPLFLRAFSRPPSFSRTTGETFTESFSRTQPQIDARDGASSSLALSSSEETSRYRYRD